MAATTKTTRPTDRLRIDFLFLDLESCARCKGTDASLDSALEVVRDVLAARGTEVEVNKVHVATAEQARALRFVSSPTVRVNGRDIALELRESPCRSEACTDGCGESTACRVWVHEGREYTQAPVAMIVDAVLREIHGETAGDYEPAAEFKLPENLERFFAGKVADGPSPVEADVVAEPGCCPATEQRSCCAAEDKADCCAGGGCGCR